MIHLGSARDVGDFVKLSTAQPGTVILDDGLHRVNGKSFMEMFCLELTRPLRVSIQCGEEQFHQFRRQAARFVID